MAFRSLGTFGKLAIVGTGVLATGTVLAYHVVPFHVDFYKAVFDINENPKYLNERISNEYNKLQAQGGDSLLKKYLTKNVYNKVYNIKTARDGDLLDVIRSGLDNPDSKVGVYAPEPSAYVAFRDLFDPIIADIHGGIMKHPSSDWGLRKINYFDKNLDPDGKYVKNTRIECLRNLAGFTFHPLMRIDDYYVLETKFKSGFLKIDDDDDLKGNYFTLNRIKKADKDMLAKEKIEFKNDDEHLKSAKVYQFWPSGRGIFYNNRNGNTLTGFIGGEDHLRLISAVPGADIKVAFERLGRCVKKLELQLKFSETNHLGYITYSPANLGSGVRATVEMKLPNASKKDFLETCDKLKLTCREGGQGVYFVSNKQTLGVSEFDSVKQLYDGVKKLIETESGEKS